MDTTSTDLHYAILIKVNSISCKSALVSISTSNSVSTRVADFKSDQLCINTYYRKCLMIKLAEPQYSKINNI